MRGLVVGAGSYALSPIPRYDELGREKGFYGEADEPPENLSEPAGHEAMDRYFGNGLKGLKTKVEGGPTQ